MSRQNSLRVTDKDVRVVDGSVDIGFFANAGPRGVGFHHAFHHTQVAPALYVAVFEKAVADHECSFCGVDRDSHGGAVVDSGPEDANSGLHLFLVGEQTQFVPSLVLQVLIHIGRDAEVARNVEMIEGGLKIFNPASPGNSDGGVAEHGNVGGSISLQWRDEDQRNVVWGKALGTQNDLRKLLFGAHDLGLWIPEKT